MSQKFKILCVEDNPDTQRMLTFLLTKAGYDVITADDHHIHPKGQGLASGPNLDGYDDAAYERRRSHQTAAPD